MQMAVRAECMGVGVRLHRNKITCQSEITYGVKTAYSFVFIINNQPTLL